MDEGVKTTDDFENVELALVAASTLIYERLYCGFKILIGMLPENKIFHEESSLNNICFHNRTELEELCEKYLDSSVDDFFEKNQLQGFHHKSYN